MNKIKLLSIVSLIASIVFTVLPSLFNNTWWIISSAVFVVSGVIYMILLDMKITRDDPNDEVRDMIDYDYYPDRD